jgi:hypothetical protein
MTDQTNHVLQLYLALMEEVKTRLGTMDRIMQGDIPLPDRAICEYCSLQVRLICEVIALASLIAHGDEIGDSRKLEKEWSAGKIVSGLERLHAGFFPIPVVMTPTTEPKGWHLELVETGFLTKAEFVALYNRMCGDSLHRGSLKNLLSGRGQPFSLDDIREWKIKISTLLEKHRVMLLSGNGFILCLMNNDQGVVEVAMAGSS